jgi:hypothetical protein
MENGMDLCFLSTVLELKRIERGGKSFAERSKDIYKY